MSSARRPPVANRPIAAGMLWACAAALAVVAAPAPSGGSERAGARTAVHEMLAHEGTPLSAYRARRVMQAANARFKAEAEMEAVTELQPDGTFRYEIVREEGSGYVRNKVLRKVLQDEARLRQRGDAAKGGLTPANYEFTEDSAGGPPDERRVLITPRRKDILLVDGAIVLSPGGDLLRIEGRLARNPSFWTRRVHVVRRYARIGGVRVPIATESVADIRFAGRSHFRMVYHYESINGQEVEQPTGVRAAETEDDSWK